ncbi:hypothetical protein ACFQE5_15415 [Pseudonocardia hispaniensis]|uniref:DUF1990 domain-containing protein n=1 Tax=Pseudonocardia hispaniensis TaxID=904933 RepID=A0ABW1J448_9PSEU
MVSRTRSRSAPGSRWHRTLILLGWPAGLTRMAWRYLWRTTPVHRCEVPADETDVRPIPDELRDEDIQDVADGVGTLLHRRYWVLVEGARASPEEVIEHFACGPNRAAPAEMAVFDKAIGPQGRLRLGDEFHIRMPGPWDGPVRVIDRGPASFRFATLRGHLEAGQIEFRARTEGATMRIEIESWARPGDRLSDLLFNHLPLAKETQLTLWVETCLRLAQATGGRTRDGVHVHTRRIRC